MVPGTHGSVECNVMWHHREFRSWVSTRWSLEFMECREQCNVSPQGVQIEGEYWIVSRIPGSVEYNVTWHHSEFRSWVSTGWSLELMGV